MDAKKKNGKKKPARSGKPLHVWIPAELRDALDALSEKTRRHLTSEVVIALENHLAANGLWPRKE
jgi:predicted DNA-binding protein